MCSGVDLVGQRRARVPRFCSTGPCLSYGSAALCQGDNEIFNCVCEVELIAQVRVRDSLGLLALLFLPHPLAQGEGKEKVPVVSQAVSSRAKSSRGLDFLLQKNFDLWDLVLQMYTDEGL